jgi:hypothetical protein
MNTPPAVTPGGSKPKTSGLAIASLVLGICSIVLCLGPLAGIPAVITGHSANSKIRQSGGLLTGSGLATAGLVTGYLSVFMIFVGGAAGGDSDSEFREGAEPGSVQHVPELS